MKLLLDENLSPKLVGMLEADYPGMQHVEDLGLRGRSDREVWDAARQLGAIVVSKDNDFRQRSFLHGAPPKVVWLSIGNVGTRVVAQLLREMRDGVHAFSEDPEAMSLSPSSVQGL